MRIYSICLTFILMIAQVQGQQQKPAPESMFPGTHTAFNTLIEGNSLFVFDLYHQLKADSRNLIFSPFSIYSAFAMAASGAKGETAAEMQKVLHYATTLAPFVGELSEALTAGTTTKNAPQVSMANAVWIQEGMTLLPPFQQAMTKSYKATLEQVNFGQEAGASLRKINQWVSKQTQGKINQLLSPQEITKQTRFVLTSAIYMKGQWEHPFDRRQTQRAPFYITDQHALQVDMMKTTAHYPVTIEEHFAMIEMPYLNTSGKGPHLSMILIMPNDVQGLETFGQELTFDNWRKWMKNMQVKKVNLSLPKFKIEQRIDLNQTMIELGMVKAFHEDADFSGINGERGLFINRAVHKSFIQVDENGTEATGATAIVMAITASKEQPEEMINFIVDRSFFYMIIDQKTQAILFMGHLTQP